MNVQKPVTGCNAIEYNTLQVLKLRCVNRCLDRYANRCPKKGLPKDATTPLILKDLTDQKSYPERSRFLDTYRYDRILRVFSINPDKGFHAGHMLFNLHRAREHASEGLIVTEGAFTLFELWQKGRRNVVSTLGCSMSEEQERLIVETARPRGKVLILYDHDQAGMKVARAAAERLMSKVFVRIVEPVN